MRTMWALAFAGLVSLSPLASGEASAQLGPRPRPNYGPGYRPQLSPYLNLIRGGNPAANYYLGTVPEQQRRADAREFRGAITDLDVRTAPPTVETGVPTVGFDNRSNPTTGGPYFNNTVGFYQRQNIPQPRTPPGQPPPLPQRRR